MLQLLKRLRRSLVAGLFVGLVVAFTATQALAAPSVDEIAGSLICSCGCTMIVSTCECGTAAQIVSDIKGMIQQGKSKEEILAYYVAQRGETALAAPTKKGFNITAWVMPFVGLAGGAGLVVGVVGMWVKKNREQEQLLDEEGNVLGVEGLSSDELHVDPKVSEYEERLNRDLDEFN